MKLNIIAALCKNGGIGYNNTLPWHFSKDLKYFSQVTRNSTSGKSAIIMGRNTWISLSKPLPNRSNYIITKNIKGRNYFKEIDECLDYCREKNYHKTWIIGGQQIYYSTITRDDIDNLYITRIEKEIKCDTFFPTIPDNFSLMSEESLVEKETLLRFQIYQNNLRE